MSISGPHDKIFKEIESIRENAADFIQATFPEELTRRLDLNSLELDNTSYIAEDLQESFSDLVYRCLYQGSTSIRISLLFEHKSSPPTHPHIQLLKYILRIWEMDIKNRQPLQIVVPVIFYHGEKEWKTTSLTDFFPGVDNILEKFIPEFDYLLTDLSRYDDAAIKDKLFKRESNRILMLLMKHIFNEKWFAEHLSKLFSPCKEFFELPEGERFLISILVYLYNTTELKTDDIIKHLSAVSVKGGEIAMTTAMKLKEEGIKEGIKEGKTEDARRMLKDGMDIERVVKYTGLSREDIEAISRNS